MLEVCAVVRDSDKHFGFDFAIKFVVKDMAGIYIAIISNCHNIS